ncbi:MAG: hypothetical protein QM817_20775 [Archangium sp.]
MTIGLGGFISVLCFLGVLITLVPPLMALMQQLLAIGSTRHGEPPSPALIRGLMAWLFASGAFIAFGGWRMRVGRSMGLSVATALMLMLPCCTSSCFVVSVPLGLWILVVLFDRGVRDTFE